ncbi:acetyl-CoA C-acetyltransferase [Candidatus Tisiphia endosymbiont of Temnostethus pusillus]|uniref:acetyl-CoA C-acetyltransferase n=1 Tax=Candidatus Tisiphia endosymbiont of Temnostethus pusillus TaxID=3139335 RepID=UPI0035C894E8
MSKKAVYITHAKRTAVGSLLGSLGSIPATKLAAIIIESILKDSKLDPAIINEVIMGQVITGGVGQNPARQALIQAGLPKEVTGFTVNKVCGSGLKTVCLAASSIIAGDNEIVIAGGQENMSLGLHGAYIRAGHKLGSTQMVDLMQYDGLTDVFSNNLMGITAENISKRFNITREMQDEFALKSHQKAREAQAEGRFKDEILPVEVKMQKATLIFDQDEGIRADIKLEVLAKLRPAFDKEGTVTAGNASSINDGAACLMVVSEEALKRYNLKPLVRIVSYAEVGVEPNIMGTGPVPASKKALDKAGWKVEDLDIIEANEAFAAQAIYVNQQMNWDINKVNMNGGAIALGHPIGASGARILVTLIHQMQKINAKKGLATLCIGGGMGIAMCIEKVN